MYRYFLVLLFILACAWPEQAEAACPPPPIRFAADATDGKGGILKEQEKGRSLNSRGTLNGSKSGSKDKGSGESLIQASCGSTTTPTPGTPGTMSVPSTDNNGAFTIRWGASSNIQKAGYYILYQSKNGSPYTVVSSPTYTSTSHAFSGVGDGSYVFKIKACNVDLKIGNEKCSGFRTSSTTTVRNTPSTPSKPSDINTTSTSYTVSWSKPSGNATYYVVQEKVGSGGWSTISGKLAGTSISRTGRSNNTTYYYRVQACNQYSWSCSSYSSQNTVRVELKPSTPSTPNSLNSTSTSYTVSWSKPSGTVNFYSVQERVAGGSWSTIASNHTSTSIARSGRSNNTNYEYRVRACNSYTWACSGYSGSNSVKVRLVPSTPAAANPSTSTDTNSVTVSWPAVTYASYYNIQRRNNSGGWVTAANSVTGTSKSLSGFTDGSWDFRIQACNGYSWACSGFGADGSSVIWRKVPSVPAAPTVPSSDIDGSYTVSWTKPSGSVSYYDLIERKNNTGSFSTVANNTVKTSAVLSGKADGAYDYQVRACNGYDWACSGYSAISGDVSVLHVPGVPSSISNPSTDTDGSITVSWGSATGRAADYRLEQRKNSGSWTQIAASDSTSKAVHSLTDGSYSYRVRACNASGCSGYRTGSAATIISLKPGTPAAPSGPSTSTGSVSVSWASVSRATYYDLQKRHNNGSWATAKAGDTNTNESLSGLTDGSWDYRVRACNTYSWSCSNYSADSSNTTVRLIPSVPAKPTTSTTSTITGSYTVNWTKPSGSVSYYDVQERKNTLSWANLVTGQVTTNAAVSSRTTGNWDYRVRACNGYSWACSGYSADSTDVNVRRVPANTSITKPTSNVSDSGSFMLEWNSASDATLYVLQQQINGGSWSTLQSNSSRTYSVSGLTNGTYGYRVKACNGGTDVCSANSVTKTIAVSVTPVYARKSSASVPDAALITPTVPANQAVGALEGQAGVSGGAATYSVPIAIPPGRAGMQPKVSLNYSSRSGNGIAGVGWSLSTGSSIHRCGKTAAQDGFGFGVTYSATEDRLCLDGQRLMVVSGSYGVSGAEYRTELDTFVKVKQSGNINGATTSFTVYHKSGDITQYGTSADSRQQAGGRSEILTWAVKKKEDRAGNNIFYNYAEFGAGEHLVTSLDYTGYGSSAGNRHVRFNYQEGERADASVSYMQGGLTLKTKLLESIETYVDQTKVRSYTLAYNDSTTSKRKVVSTITECAFDEGGVEACLPASSFDTYSPNLDWADVDSSDANQSPIGDFGTLKGSDRIMLKDLDGNGVAEALYMDEKQDGTFDVRVYILNSEGKYVEHASANLGGYDHLVYAGIEGDINGDGITDFITEENRRLVYFQFDKNFNLVRHATSFYFTSGYDRIIAGQGLQVTDVDSDGYQDILFTKLMNNSRTKVVYYRNKGNGNVDFSGPHIVVDVSGTSWNSVAQDFDNDGLVDFGEMAYGPSGRVNGIYFSQRSTSGILTASRVSSGSLGLDSSADKAVFADLNGDGLKDYVFVKNSNWHVQVNKGNRTFKAAQSLGTNVGISDMYSYPAGTDSHDKIEKTGRVVAADFDGDGAEELMVATHSTDSFMVTFFGERLEYPGGPSTGQFLEVCVKDDELYVKKVLVKSCGGGTTGPDFDADYSIFDFRRFHWSIVDFKTDSSANLVHERTIADVVNAPLNGIKLLDGTRALPLSFNDFNNDGYLDFSYQTIDGFTWLKDGNYVTVQGITVTRGGFGGSFQSTPSPIDGMFIHNNAIAHSKQLVDTAYRATDGLVNVSEWDFAPISRPELVNGSRLYTVPDNRYIDNDPNGEHFYFTSSMPVVTNLRQSDGIGGMDETTYRYKEAIYNRMGRGFQGFRTVIIESENGQRAVSDFSQIFPYAGKLEEARTCLISDDELCKTDPLTQSTVTFDYKNTANSKVYWTFPTQSIAKTFDLNNRSTQLSKKTTTISKSDTDDFGNVLVKTNRLDNGFSDIETKTTNHFYAHDENDWWVNKLNWSEVRSETISNSSAVYNSILDPVKTIKTTIASYDGNGSRKPSNVETNPGDGKIVTVNSVFNGYGLPTNVTTSSAGESSRVITTGYSSDNYFVAWVDSGLGKVHTSSYATHGQPFSSTDVNGLITNHDYDAFGRAEKVTPPVGTAQPAYSRIAICAGDCDGHGFNTDVASRIAYKQMSYTAGAPEGIVYKDKFNRAIATATKAFDGSSYIYTTVVYDKFGRKVLETNPSYDAFNTKGVHYNRYDALGRLTEKATDQALNKQMVVTYSHSGHKTDIVANGEGKLLNMSRTYATDGQLIQTTDALSGVTQYAYDAMGNPVVLKDANNHPITATYNALGQKKWVDDPNMGKKIFAYTGFGEVDSETDANGNTYSYKYDVQGRLYERYVNNSLEASFTFDSASQGGSGVCVGLPVSETSTNGNQFTLTHTYDSFCRPVQSTTTIDGDDFVMSTQYDNNYGRIKAVTYPTGITLENWYTAEGYLSHQVNAANDYVYHEITAADARGQVLNAIKANGVLTEGRSYDSVSGQLTAVYTNATNLGTQRHRIEYVDYDGFGNLKKQRVETTTNNGVVTSTEEYIYDDLHRLTQSSLILSGNTTSIDYRYDAVGNLTRKDDFASSFAYGSLSRSIGNAGPNAVRSVTKVGGGTVTYQYDNNGNRTHENGSEVIRYNTFNKPVWINKGGVVSNFYYGSDQMRYKQVKTGKSGGDETTIYIGKAYEEIRYNGKTTKKSYLSDSIITEKVEGNSTSYEAGFVHRDRLDSVVTITDENGNVVDNKSFDPFGKPRKATMERIDPTEIATLTNVANVGGYLNNGDSTELTTRRGFTDHEHLDDAELIHMNGRVYDYNIGRFLSVDPFIQEPGNSQSMNPYSYIMNNPMAGTDPSGYYADMLDNGRCTDASFACFMSMMGIGWAMDNGSSRRQSAAERAAMFDKMITDIMTTADRKGKEWLENRGTVIITRETASTEKVKKAPGTGPNGTTGPLNEGENGPRFEDPERQAAYESAGAALEATLDHRLADISLDFNPFNESTMIANMWGYKTPEEGNKNFVKDVKKAAKQMGSDIAKVGKKSTVSLLRIVEKLGDNVSVLSAWGATAPTPVAPALAKISMGATLISGAAGMTADLVDEGSINSKSTKGYKALGVAKAAEFIMVKKFGVGHGKAAQWEASIKLTTKELLSEE
ncbi:fibronectin type III domain-containing protein [Aliikangiella coralliicola]|uniref:Fibronectin type-III domain-containing protein n=1 Tax=Aliikangiella coralliicola TaxID=2592383 RepID=A0A545UEZ5_9GAMM|nr:FG-GAP-like repeat-containing protein [Aliikangiella coralliicola]TQV88051.1 hypothetical protein FLL46_09590 [Aliikangiella coralliicola]